MKTMAIATKLTGHTKSLLCCHAPLSAPQLVATSSQDGTVCLFDIRSNVAVQRLECFGREAVTSICFSPANSEILYAGAGRAVYCMDVRLGSSGREVQKYNFNLEEINQVALNQKASYLAAADDHGEIKVIDLHTHKLMKTLHGVHTNICSTVQFHPHRPWELISGGLDSKIVKWDFCKGKPIKVIDQGATVASYASNALGSQQLCNPPFVHALSTQESKLSGEAGRVMAIAKGDGAVEICDVGLENWQELQRHGIKFRHLNQDKKSKGRTAQHMDTYDKLDDKVGAHSAAVSCVTLARFSQNGSVIVSGSNDRSVNLWTWSQKDKKPDVEGHSATANGEPLLLNINHRKKVNWLSTAATSSENLFVADTSKVLTVYTVQ